MSGIDSDLIRGHIDTIILKTLFDGDKYGYEILDEVSKKSDGAYELKQPTLYSCLKRLESQGLISSYWVDSEIGGKRHYYCLTEQGKETYIENQKNWLRSRQIIDNLIWENAPAMPSRDVITDNQSTETNSEEENNLQESENLGSVIDYIPPTPVSSDENNDEIKTEEQETDTDNLLESLINDDNSNIDSDKEIIGETESNNNDSIDIMTLLGHFDNQEQNTIDSHIEKINEVTENLNSIEEEYSTDKFLENFVKNYMSSDEVKPTQNIIDEEPNLEEISDDFNLDLSKHLDSNDSYFSSIDSKDKVNFITPNVVIDNLRTTEPEPDFDSSHIEFIDDEQINTTEDEEENTVTPTYVSFGEEIVRSQDDTAYSYISNKDELVDSNNVDLDSIYINPENNQEEITYTNYEEVNNNYSYDNNDDNISYNTYNEELFNSNITEEKSENVETEKTQEIYRPSYNTTIQGFEVIPSKYTDDESKRKITELTNFAKESTVSEEQTIVENNLFDTNDFLERNKASKNYDKLIADFEREGLSVRVHKKLVKESKESRSYVETNKIKMTRNWISFCFISTILAIVFAVMKSNDITYYAFSYKYFVIGILVSLIVPIVSTIIYALNPYRKHVASFSPGASFMLSALVFVQLLLIIYCVNLQLGFYSFKQEYYNHLFWIIPSIIAIYPILNSIVYTTLFKSKNFHS